MSTKSSVLAFLEENRGKNISGAQISQALQVTRSAVWKAIEDLRKDGYEITAATNRGYCLSDVNNFLSPEGIRPYLLPQFGVLPIHVYPEVESTNLTAKQLALEGATNGTAVLAETQHMGKGRMGRTFLSHRQSGVYLSLILRLEQEMEQVLLITAAAAVATARAIQKAAGIDPQIKWVNDIYCNSKKVCGILTEAVTSMESRTIDFMVVGIGVNVSMKREDFPEELRQTATSLELEGAGRISRNRLAAEIINQLLLLSQNLTSPDWMEEYKARSCILGKEIHIFRGGTQARGTALDITPQGHLAVRLEDGSNILLNSGEISIRPV